MKMKLLLPHKLRVIGFILLPVAIGLLVAVYAYDISIPFLRHNMPSNLLGGKDDFIFHKNFSADFSGELAILATLASLFMIAFSREKHEDEYVSAIRLHALQLSVYINYLILALASMLIYGLSFLMVMELNLFTIPILFIVIYYFNLHIKPRFSRSATV